VLDGMHLVGMTGQIASVSCQMLQPSALLYRYLLTSLQEWSYLTSRSSSSMQTGLSATRSAAIHIRSADGMGKAWIIATLRPYWSKVSSTGFRLGASYDPFRVLPHLYPPHTIRTPRGYDAQRCVHVEQEKHRY